MREASPKTTTSSPPPPIIVAETAAVQMRPRVVQVTPLRARGRSSIDIIRTPPSSSQTRRSSDDPNSPFSRTQSWATEMRELGSARKLSKPNSGFRRLSSSSKLPAVSTPSVQLMLSVSSVNRSRPGSVYSVASMASHGTSNADVAESFELAL